MKQTPECNCQKGGEIYWILLCMATGLLSQGCASKEYVAESCANIIVSENLKSPSTADFHNHRVIREKDGEFLVFVSVDAANSFGAKVRTHFLVIAIPDFDNSGWFSVKCNHRKNASAIQCSNSPTESEIMLIGELNGW